MTQGETVHTPINHMSAEEAGLWRQVIALWDMTVSGDTTDVVDALHPHYSGWVTGLDSTQDRNEAVRSVGPGAPPVLGYHLTPLKVTVIDGVVGIVHYRYEGYVDDGAGGQRTIRGRWSEIYLRENGRWVMVSVSGGPDGQR